VHNSKLGSLLEESARSDRLVAQEELARQRTAKHWRTCPGQAATCQNPYSLRKPQYLPCCHLLLRTHKPFSKVTKTLL
jgi:hypothetical protein